MKTQSAMPAATNEPGPLPSDLAQPILAICVHIIAASSLWQPAAITQPLNALSRTHAPLSTKVALMQMPHIDLNSATQLGDISLLEFMLQWSRQPAGRPLHYASNQVLSFALKCDESHVLDWWLDQPGSLFLHWDWGWGNLMDAFCEPADLMWLGWWKTRGFPYLELGDGESTFARMAVHASQAGRVDVLDWLLENDAGAHWMAAAKGGDKSAIVAAARKGRVQVLEWWCLHVQAGTLTAKVDWIQLLSTAFSEGNVDVLEWCEKQPLAMEAWQQPLDWVGVFSAAFSSGHAAVLEWCKSQPSVMQAWRQGCENRVHAKDTSEISSMCYSVVRHHGPGLDWLHAFNLLPFAQSNSNVTRTACEKGDVDLVKELHGRGYLLGSFKQLVEQSLSAGKLELLEWIQANVDPSTADSTGLYLGCDPYIVACEIDGVDILDWLLANGFRFPPPGKSRARVFQSAASDGRFDILEWLFKNGFANDMKMEDWISSFGSAGGKGNVDVLDWLAERIPRTAGTAAPASRIPTTMLWDVFGKGQVDVLEWWMHKSGWLKDVYDLAYNQPYLQACSARHGFDAQARLAALKAWFDGGQPMDFAKCIHEASISGRVDVLGWLLHSTSASEEDFVKAWSSDEFPDERTAGNMSAFYRFDIDNHSQSLTWWRANLPHVAALRANRGPYDNPIHAHYLKHVLRNTSFELLQPHLAIDEYDGCADLLEYRRRTGNADDLEEHADWYLEEASLHGQCHVLEWFKVASGIRLKCPTAIVDGKTEITRHAKVWWARSGLFNEEQLARIKAKLV